MVRRYSPKEKAIINKVFDKYTTKEARVHALLRYPFTEGKSYTALYRVWLTDKALAVENTTRDRLGTAYTEKDNAAIERAFATYASKEERLAMLEAEGVTGRSYLVLLQRWRRMLRQRRYDNCFVRMSKQVCQPDMVDVFTHAMTQGDLPITNTTLPL